MNKIISYSLWFQNKPMDGYKYQTHNMYYNGMVRNLEILNKKEIYKDWTIRCYINNTVSSELQETLKNLGAELIDMTGSKIPGMFWRFLPLNDSSVDIFIVRDTDSRINLREYRAVNEWLESDKLLHVMRDHPHHYYKILGGMWGYKNYLQRIDIIKPMDKFLQQRNYKFKRMDDMTFLDSIYDSLNGKSMEHDQFFKYKYSQPFPDDSYQNDYYHFVGEIFDEYDNNPYKERDTKLLKDRKYKHIMKNHNKSKYFK